MAGRDLTSSPSDLGAEADALRALVADLQAENARLLQLMRLTRREAAIPDPSQTGLFERAPGAVDGQSPPAAKVAFFAALFGSRKDVYAVRWENSRTGRSGWMPAVAGGWHKGLAGSRDRRYLPLTPEVVTSHLSGETDLGLYPLLDGDRCHWLAADFDGALSVRVT